MRAAISIPERVTVDSANMALLAKAVALGGGDHGGARDIAERLGMPDKVMKAIVSPMFVDDTDIDGLADTRTILTSFVPLLRNVSAFFRLFDTNSLVRIPLRTRVSYGAGAASFAVVGEGKVIQVERMQVDGVMLEPHRVTGILIFTTEMLKWLSSGGEAFLSMELRRAIAAAVDLAFFALIQDGSTPSTASLGTTASAAVADMRALFNAAGLTAESKPLLVAAPDVAISAATLYDGGFVFPAMSPTGGTMCNVECIVSDAMATGTLGLIDGMGIAGSAEGITIESARHADVQFSDAPDSPATGSTPIVNLWQHNLIGLRPQIYFSAERLRDNAYSKITGINWGSTDSPA